LLTTVYTLHSQHTTSLEGALKGTNRNGTLQCYSIPIQYNSITTPCRCRNHIHHCHEVDTYIFTPSAKRYHLVMFAENDLPKLLLYNTHSNQQLYHRPLAHSLMFVALRNSISDPRSTSSVVPTSQHPHTNRKRASTIETTRFTKKQAQQQAKKPFSSFSMAFSRES